jgi:hypothetical protein
MKSNADVIDLLCSSCGWSFRIRATGSDFSQRYATCKLCGSKVPIHRHSGEESGESPTTDLLDPDASEGPITREMEPIFVSGKVEEEERVGFEPGDLDSALVAEDRAALGFESADVPAGSQNGGGWSVEILTDERGRDPISWRPAPTAESVGGDAIIPFSEMTSEEGKNSLGAVHSHSDLDQAREGNEISPPLNADLSATVIDIFDWRPMPKFGSQTWDMEARARTATTPESEFVSMEIEKTDRIAWERALHGLSGGGEEGSTSEEREGVADEAEEIADSRSPRLSEFLRSVRLRRSRIETGESRNGPVTKAKIFHPLRSFFDGLAQSSVRTGSSNGSAETRPLLLDKLQTRMKSSVHLLPRNGILEALGSGSYRLMIDGIAYGPITAEKIVDLKRAGEIPRGTHVARGDDSWGYLDEDVSFQGLSLLEESTGAYEDETIFELISGERFPSEFSADFEISEISDSLPEFHTQRLFAIGEGAEAEFDGEVAEELLVGRPEVPTQELLCDESTGPLVSEGETTDGVPQKDVPTGESGPDEETNEGVETDNEAAVDAAADLASGRGEGETAEPSNEDQSTDDESTKSQPGSENLGEPRTSADFDLDFDPRDLVGDSDEIVLAEYSDVDESNERGISSHDTATERKGMVATIALLVLAFLGLLAAKELFEGRGGSRGPVMADTTTDGSDTATNDASVRTARAKVHGGIVAGASPKRQLATARQTGDVQAAVALLEDAWRSERTDENARALARALLTIGRPWRARRLAVEGVVLFDSDPFFQKVFTESISQSYGKKKEVTITKIKAAKMVPASVGREYEIVLQDGKTVVFRTARRGKPRWWRNEIAAYRLCQLIVCQFEMPRTLAARVSRVALAKALVGKDKDAFWGVAWNYEPNANGDRDEFVHGAQVEVVGDSARWPMELDMIWRRWLNPESVVEIFDQKIDVTFPSKPATLPFVKNLFRESKGKSTRVFGRQISSLVLFDFLTNNWARYESKAERYGENLRLDDGQLISLNHHRTFQPRASKRVRGRFSYVGKFSKRSISSLRLLDPDVVDQALFPSPTLSERARLKVFWKQREVALRTVDGFTVAYGPKQVMVFR